MGHLQTDTRRSLLLLPLVLLARGAAFMVPIYLAGRFGVGAEMDAFYYALGVPTFLLMVGHTALGTVLIPLLAANPQTPLLSLAWRVAAVAAGIAAIEASILSAILPWLTGFDAPTRALTAGFARDLIPFLAVMSAGTILRVANEVRRNFQVSALGPLLRALGTVGGAWWLQDLQSLPAAMLLGGLMEAAWYATSLPLRLGALPPELTRGIGAVWVVIAGEGLVSLNVLVDRAFAATLAPGSVTLLEYADRVRLIPQALLDSSLIMVAYAGLAAAPAADRPLLTRRALARVIRLSAPMLGGIAVAAVPICRLLFERGRFDPAHTPAVAAGVIAFLPGVLASLVGALVMKAHVLAGRQRLVGLLGIASFLTNAALDALLGPILGVPGLALATSLCNGAVVWIALALLPDRRGGGDRATLASLGISAGLALLFAPAAPDQVWDPLLWAMAVPFLALLALMARRPEDR